MSKEKRRSSEGKESVSQEDVTVVLPRTHDTVQHQPEPSAPQLDQSQEETSQQAKYTAIKTEIMQAYDNFSSEFEGAERMWTNIDAKATEMAQTLQHDEILEHTKLYGEAGQIWGRINSNHQVLREEMETKILPGFEQIDDAASRNNLRVIGWGPWCQSVLREIKSAGAAAAAGIQELDTFLDRLKPSRYRHK